MPSVVYSAAALADLERLAAFLAAEAPAAAEKTSALIGQALAILEANPLIGRDIGGGLRELVISRGATGYVGLYSFDDRWDRVLVYAIRQQREVGYDD